MIIALDARPLVRRQIGGAEQRARNIFSAWRATQDVEARAADPAGPGHQFRLIYAPPEGPDLFDDSLLKDLPANFQPVEIASFQLPSQFHAGSRVLNALARTLSRVRADVYHSFTPEVPRTGACPVVPTIHDLSFELDPMVRRTPAGRKLHSLTSAGIRHGRLLIAISSQTKNDIASIYRLNPDRIAVIYNGIDPVFAAVPASEIPTRRPVHIANQITARYVLAVGADIPRRNYERLLAAMRLVWATPEGAATHWVLAGREDWKISNIYSAARTAGVLSNMRFVHAPSNVELVDLYRAATITACASSFEGFGLSVLESMACGTSVACSDMRSLREVAADAAVYFPHDDPQSMGEAIAGLLEDAEYRRELKYRGLERARLFTWATAASLTLETLAAAARR